jgi:hypothetical protein
MSHLIISDITLISKSGKHSDICLHKSNQSKHKYSIKILGKFHSHSGSLNYPNLSFKGEYIDILVKNFPRYPSFYQNKYSAKNILNGFTANELNNGFPKQLLYRKIEITNI